MLATETLRVLMGNRVMKKIINSLAITVSSRKYWPIWLFFLLLGAIDVSYRFVGKLGFQSADEYLAQPVSMQKIPVLSVETLERYMDKLGEYTEQKEPAVIDSAISDVVEESPNLGFWRGSDYDYQLLAIFSTADTFAVLSRFDGETGESQIVEVRERDMMGDFVVDQISKHVLTLSGPEKSRVELMLFRPLEDLSSEADSSEVR